MHRIVTMSFGGDVVLLLQGSVKNSATTNTALNKLALILLPILMAAYF